MQNPILSARNLYSLFLSPPPSLGPTSALSPQRNRRHHALMPVSVATTRLWGTPRQNSRWRASLCFGVHPVPVAIAFARTRLRSLSHHTLIRKQTLASILEGNHGVPGQFKKLCSLLIKVAKSI